jgi:glucose/arabinose dehydrogenase
VANYNGNTVSEVTPGGTVSTFASGFDGPSGLAFDGSGNLYVANALSNLIDRVSPTGSVTLFATLLEGDRPGGPTFAQDGNLYVVCSGSNGLDKVTPSGNVSGALGGLDDPQFVVLSPVPEPNAHALIVFAAFITFAWQWRGRARLTEGINTLQSPS